MSNDKLENQNVELSNRRVIWLSAVLYVIERSLSMLKSAVIMFCKSSSRKETELIKIHFEN